MKKLLSVLFICLASITFATSASAVTIIKFDLGGTGPDLNYTGGVLNTSDDGVAATTGNQNTTLDFVGFLDPLFADILNVASLSINNVTSIGGATTSGSLVTQLTTGGTFSLYDQANLLLLSGTLTDGALVGSNSTSVGSFFNTSIATFDGGSLLSVVATTPAALSISFTNLLTAGNPGLLVNGNGILQDFTADATGQIEGTRVPEPTSIALLFSGVAGLVARSRSKKAKA